MTAYGAAFDRVFTRIDAERAHHLGFRGLRAAAWATDRVWGRRAPDTPVQAMGLSFPNALGVAAGFDKNAVGIDALAALGFGHVEVGTVTGQPQPGNPRPRLFRLPQDRAVLNRMGFNNDGAEAVAHRLADRAAGRVSRRSSAGPILGVNIGKTKVVPEDDQAAVETDYRKSAGLLAPYADYLVVNVSSPNTPGLRSLQSVERLEPLLAAVRERADQVVVDRRVPLLVKIAPDLADEDVLAVADLALARGLDGIIATNTTISREGLCTDADRIDQVGAGGLSGAPVRARAAAVVAVLRTRLPQEFCVIGVGGISDTQDARDRLTAGATLLQVYSGFVYGGPAWPARVLRGLAT